MNYQKRKDRPANYLNVKERTVLKALIRNSRTSNAQLGKILKITPQATGRIRRKLKSEGFIKNYGLELDYHSMGIRVFSLVLFDMETSYEEKVMSANLISFYKALTNSATHIALYAFKSLEESNCYFEKIHNDYSEHINIIEMHSFPLKGVVKHSHKDLFNDLIKSPSKNQHSQKNNLLEITAKDSLLSQNEKSVLRHFVKDPRIPCGKISYQLNDAKLTRSGVNRIKQRLENKRIIKNYTIKLDYEKLGIKILSFVFIAKKPGYWKIIEAIDQCIQTFPNIIGCYRLNEEGMESFLCGFKELKDLENLCKNVLTQQPDLLKIKHVYVMSPSGEIKDSSADLFLSLLND